MCTEPPRDRRDERGEKGFTLARLLMPLAGAQEASAAGPVPSRTREAGLHPADGLLSLGMLDERAQTVR